MSDDIERPVREQLTAYNAGDIDAFVEAFDVQVRIYDVLTGETLMQGRDALRKAYGPMFAANPELNAEIVHRAVMGGFVIDQESITGRGEPIEALAIYEVSDGTIVSVGFLRPRTP